MGLVAKPSSAEKALNVDTTAILIKNPTHIVFCRRAGRALRPE
jgi:type III secretory pathway component EscU